MKYLFECADGHRFERAASDVLYRMRGCVQCRRQAVRERFDEIVAQRGGKCDDGGYLGHRLRHRMRCEHGHEWSPDGRSVLQGIWCPHCARVGHRPPSQRVQKYGLADLQAKAAEHGGCCLATVYGAGHDHYPFECAAGHRWLAMGYKVLKGSWCRHCTNERLGASRADAGGLARLQAAARGYGGQCLTSAYQGVNALHKFRCAMGHEWETAGKNVLSGRWCRQCGNEKQKLGIAAMHALALARGGLCLSDVYVNNKTKLMWECDHGHVWAATPGTIRHHWCPQCAILKSIRAKSQWKRRRYEAGGETPAG